MSNMRPGESESLSTSKTSNQTACVGLCKRCCNSFDDLLAALKELKRWCVRPGDDGKHDDGYDAAMALARVALAKATGR